MGISKPGHVAGHGFLRLLRLGLAIAAAAFSGGAALAQRASTVVASPRQSYEFSRGWLMHVGDDAGFAGPTFDDRGWTAVTLPHAFNETEAFARDVHQLSEAIIWYRKHFRLPADAPHGRAFLEFQGVRQAADVWVNGIKVGTSENGVMAFGLDITNLKVTNNRDDKDSAIVEIKFWKGSEVLASADCTTSPIAPGTTARVTCISGDKLPKSYEKITINDTF